MNKRVSAISLTLIAYIIIIACKSALLGPTYPISDFKEYNYVIIATVDKAIHANNGYRPLKTFNVTIKKCIKGNLKIGSQIYGKAEKEEAQAVCPVHLEEKADYLLLLNKTGGNYKLSRFSFPVKKGYKYFDDYITQIEKILAPNKAVNSMN